VVSDSSGAPGSLTATMQTKNPPKCGRSSGYSAEIADAICNRLVNGESLRAICADPAMPAKATVCRWLARNQEFRRSYAIARECQAEDFADAILEIADGCSDIRHARRRIGVLKLAAGRMARGNTANAKSRAAASAAAAGSLFATPP
jgi:hypothetical protein